MTENAAAAPDGDNGGAQGGAAPNPAGAALDGGAQGGTAPVDWQASMTDDQRAYIKNKGWADKDPAQAMLRTVDSYRNLEKFAGGAKNLVEIPGEDADDDARNQFYSKLGRPDSAENYGIELPDGGDKEMHGWFQETAHKYGLTVEQAKGVFGDYQEMAGARIEGMEAATREQGEADIKALKSEWGQGYEGKIDAGQRAVAALGYEEAELTTLENKLGTAEMLKLFARMGDKMGEESFAGGPRSNNAGFGLTPADAKAQLADLKLDEGFMSKYLAGDKDAVAKRTRLMEIAHG